MPAYPDPPSHCIEADEFMAGLEAYHAGELFDGDQPIAWRNGWRAGEAGRRLPKVEEPESPWAWLEDYTAGKGRRAIGWKELLNG